MPRGIPNKKAEEKKVEELKVSEEVKSEKVDTDVLLKKILELEKRDEENQKKLQKLYAVADKGRLFNYENSQTEKKPFRVKLSVYNGKYVVGWRTVRDELITDPRTGATVGEMQEYEVLLFDNQGMTTVLPITGYANFSNLRYNERVECEVVSKKEDYEGKMTFDLSLPDGRIVSIGGQFVN